MGWLWVGLEWIKCRREKGIPTAGAKAEYDKLEGTNPQIFDKYVSESLQVFHRHLFCYLLDFTKDNARIDILANNGVGAFEDYRTLLHKVLDVNGERALDLGAQVLNPRKAKPEKDVAAALQEYKNDQMWLVEAGYTHTYDLLKQHDSKMACEDDADGWALSAAKVPPRPLVQNRQLRRVGGGAFRRAAPQRTRRR